MKEISKITEGKKESQKARSMEARKEYERRYRAGTLPGQQEHLKRHIYGEDRVRRAREVDNDLEKSDYGKERLRYGDDGKYDKCY